MKPGASGIPPDLVVLVPSGFAIFARVPPNLSLGGEATPKLSSCLVAISSFEAVDALGGILEGGAWLGLRIPGQYVTIKT